jgi:UDP-3-O-[3-hydroxymyristoyl] glucosamine N-acyltransferase
LESQDVWTETSVSVGIYALVGRSELKRSAFIRNYTLVRDSVFVGNSALVGGGSALGKSVFVGRPTLAGNYAWLTGLPWGGQP